MHRVHQREVTAQKQYNAVIHREQGKKSQALRIKTNIILLKKS